MFYVTKIDMSGTYIGSYLSREAAEKYNPGAIVFEDTIMSEDVGFPIPGLVLIGYSKKDDGATATRSLVDAPHDKLLYAKTPLNQWTLVASYDTGGMSRMTNQYSESILLDRKRNSDIPPRDIIGVLDLCSVVSVATAATSFNKGKGSLSVSDHHGIYDV